MSEMKCKCVISDQKGRNRLMKRISRRIILVVCIAILLGSVSFVSRAFSNKEIPREVYKQAEDAYLETVKEVIRKEYRHAGVMLYYLKDTSGNREYTVEVHHKRLEVGNKEQERALFEMIRQVPLKVCDISYEDHIRVSIY